MGPSIYWYLTRSSGVSYAWGAEGEGKVAQGDSRYAALSQRTLENLPRQYDTSMPSCEAQCDDCGDMFGVDSENRDGEILIISHELSGHLKREPAIPYHLVLYTSTSPITVSHRRTSRSIKKKKRPQLLMRGGTSDEIIGVLFSFLFPSSRSSLLLLCPALHLTDPGDSSSGIHFADCLSQDHREHGLSWG